jgi:hypothetical protein
MPPIMKSPHMLKKQIIMKPKSVRELKKYLKPPLSEMSAVVYFTEKNNKPFLLDREGGISAKGEYRLPRNWKPSDEKLDRIFIITVEDHPHGDSTDGPPE